MYKVLETRRSASGSPSSGAVLVNGHLYTVQIPRNPETGEPDNQGDITLQTHRVLSQLRETMEVAGGSLRDVAQVVIYLVNADDAPGMNAVYREYFSEPYPNRATVVVKELMGKNRLIEIVVNAYPGISTEA
jgi:2-iminobutanoate/2-iminopropanoate deaminase